MWQIIQLSSTKIQIIVTPCFQSKPKQGLVQIGGQTQEFTLLPNATSVVVTFPSELIVVDSQGTIFLSHHSFVVPVTEVIKDPVCMMPTIPAILTHSAETEQYTLTLDLSNVPDSQKNGSFQLQFAKQATTTPELITTIEPVIFNAVGISQFVATISDSNITVSTPQGAGPGLLQAVPPPLANNDAVIGTIYLLSQTTNELYLYGLVSV